jgi:hypothetical protein
MKSLDALYPVFWSITAIMTLYLVLHRPAAGVEQESVIANPTQCELPAGTVVLIELSTRGR